MKIYTLTFCGSQPGKTLYRNVDSSDMRGKREKLEFCKIQSKSSPLIRSDGLVAFG